MTYLAPEVVSTYFLPRLYEAVHGFFSAGHDGDGKTGDDA